MKGKSKMQQLGERIRQMRTARGLSQAELGDGRYSGSYISHIESGRRQPGGEVLTFIAERLGLPMGELLPNEADAAEADVVSLLSTVRRMLTTHQWDAAVRTARQASKLAASLGHEMRAWEADFLLAGALMSAGRYDQAAELARELASRPEAANADDLCAEAHTLASRAFRASGRLADAATEATLAVADAEGREPGLLAAALIALIAPLTYADRWDEAAETAARLEAVLDELEPTDAALVVWALGNHAFTLGKMDEGLAWHAKGVELCDARIDLRSWARLRLSTAHYLVAMDGDLDLAQVHLDDAWPIVRLIGNIGDMADLRLVQARMQIRRGQLPKAIELLTHLCGETAAIDDQRLTGEIRESLAEALTTAGRIDEAREQWRIAAGCYEAAQAPLRALAMWHRYAAAEA